jgi:AcrR family transcriptional regulator
MPGARERLVLAAVDLFIEQGYDDTTVAQIAERAGVTRSTFFRHFSDKREVLVAGQEFPVSRSDQRSTNGRYRS